MTGSTITLEDYPLEDAIRIFRSAGFDTLEVWKHHLKRCKTAELRQRFAAWAKGCGIGMGGFNAVGEDYFQPFGTDAELEATLEGLQADTQIALALGARDLLIWRAARPKGPANPTGWSVCCRGLRSFCVRPLATPARSVSEFSPNRTRSRLG